MAENLTIPKVAWYKRKLIWMLFLVLLAGGGGGAAWFLMNPAEQAAKAKPEDTSNRAIYVSLSQPFVFSVPGGTRDRLVQIEAQLMVRGESNESLAKQHLPLLESTLLDVFSRQSADNYLTAANKKALRQEALNELNHATAEVLEKRLFEKVLFTSIVMQ
ncbi:flagellar basal body-associated FliL family protein [Oceanimonas sp. CHS3-5]|uniref:flagellar basal body-associated FliL family protein n=1 Tax=Oceanimonas sp. CHS3-5 TaxID=3068186 RepID=UPI00274004CF|nr:flagellar basal body-associated FliL family protein [Oceanimonas sp. CHS3-5]MDP5290717.1 flagellar basal body-associated FliL family protein [Oceanimonas sp. CHS3-5]